MNKETFINTLKDRFKGRVAADTSLDEIIGRQFDVVQAAIEKSGKRYNFQTTEASLTVAVGTSTPQVIPLPVDFLSLVYEDAFRLYDSDDNLLVVLERRSFAKLAKTHSSTREYPIRYAKIGTNLYLFPYNPTSIKTLKIFYHQSAQPFSELGSTASNYWLTEASDYFLGTVGIIIGTQVITLESTSIQLFAAQAALGERRLEMKEASEEDDDSFHDQEEL